MFLFSGWHILNIVRRRIFLFNIYTIFLPVKHQQKFILTFLTLHFLYFTERTLNIYKLNMMTPAYPWTRKVASVKQFREMKMLKMRMRRVMVEIYQFDIGMMLRENRIIIVSSLKYVLNAVLCGRCSICRICQRTTDTRIYKESRKWEAKTNEGKNIFTKVKNFSILRHKFIFILFPCSFFFRWKKILRKENRK